MEKLRVVKNKLQIDFDDKILAQMIQVANDGKGDVVTEQQFYEIMKKMDII